MQKIFLVVVGLLMFWSCGNSTGEKKIQPEENKEVAVAAPAVKPEYLNENTFREKVFDFTSGKEWSFVGDKPCIIDFYADWCAPCRRLSPILEEISKEYDGKINVYKVNTDQNQNLSAYFNVTSIPAVLFCPKAGKPQMMVGLYPKDEYVKAISQILGVK